jgi:hypothetical protein
MVAEKQSRSDKATKGPESGVKAQTSTGCLWSAACTAVVCNTEWQEEEGLFEIIQVFSILSEDMGQV